MEKEISKTSPLSHAILTGPVLPTLLRLGLPTITVLLVQTFVSILETYFISKLGTETVAGVALVFPVLLLMTTMSAGGIGGGVSSAIAHAVGAGKQPEANRLLWHALLLACICGGAFTIGIYLGGPALFTFLGGSGKSLMVAIHYAHWIFAGAIPIWCVNLMTAGLRGAGNVKVPAFIMLGGAALLIPLSPALIFGLGPMAGFGVSGAGMAVLTYYCLATLILIAYCRRQDSHALRLSQSPLQSRYFRDILRVGALSALGTLQGNFTLLIITGAVGLFGTHALAGYGLASRLDSFLIPVLFGLGTAVLTMVGMNVGAGQIDRAMRITWIGALLAAAYAEAIGLLAAWQPTLWLQWFTQDPAVLVAGSHYLHRVGPSYGFFAMGLLIYFASQGLGSVVGPFISGAARLLITSCGWGLVLQAGAPINTLYATVALASVVFGLLNVWFVSKRLCRLL